MPSPPRLAALPLLLVLLAGCVEGTAIPTTTPAPASAAPSTNCAVTPYADGPPTGSENDRDIGGLRPYRWYGGDGLWAFPWLYGEPPGTLYVDTKGFHKVLWWREPGVRGAITVTARRLDGPTAPIQVDFEGSPSQQGQQPGGLGFPTPGCWEITGTTGGKRLTIVALIAPRPGTPTAPTPTRAAQPGMPSPSAARQRQSWQWHAVGRVVAGGAGRHPRRLGEAGRCAGDEVPLWRGPGGRGSLTIAGRRLDAPAPPLTADIPNGYGDTGFQATAIIFSTAGCWEVTGKAGDASLTFVALVMKADPSRATPTPPLPAGCDEEAIRRVVGDFIAAFNAGDQAGLARVFPAKGSDGDHPWVGDPNQLRWFTLTRASPSTGVDALNLYTREKLLAYFAERHERHERMRVVELVINSVASGPMTAAINFLITHTADDLPESTFGGKGGVGCAPGVIFLWSAGGPSGGPVTPTP